MRHRVSGKHLGRSPSHRRAMRRNLAASLFEHGAVRTTEAKAKDVRRFVEKLITIARRGDLHSRRLVIAKLQDRRIYDSNGDDVGQTVVQRLFDDIAPRYVGRSGGYTRIIRLSDRRIGDSGVQVLLQLVEEQPAEGSGSRAGSARRRAKAAKRIQVAAAAQRAARGGGAEAEADEPAVDEETDVAEAPGDEAVDDEQAPAAEDEAPADESDDESKGDE